MAELTDKQIETGWWEIAKVGKWNGGSGGKAVKVQITQKDIEAMAEDYGPGIQEAPLTIEHEQSGPALGWVSALRVVGDTLQAQFSKMSGVLKDWLKTGAYRTRSIEFYKPFSETKRPYLAAVTFLGAAAPAVKGLNPEPVAFREGEPRFSIEDDNVELTNNPENEDKPMSKAQELYDTVKKFFGNTIPNNQQDGSEDMDLKEQLKEQILDNVKLKTSETALTNKLDEQVKLTTTETERADTAEKKLAELETTAKMTEFKAAIDLALKEERILPVDAKQYLSLGEKLDDKGRTEILEDVSKRNPLKMFKELTAEDKDDKKLTSRTADIRKMAEDDTDPESKREALAACDLMEQPGNEKMEFTEARKLVIKAEAK